MFVLPLIVLTLATAPAFDAGPWLEDLDQTQRALAEEYANLEWAVFEREADLPRLFADARSRLKTVSSDLQARAVFDSVVGSPDRRWTCRFQMAGSSAEERGPRGSRCVLEARL